MLGFASRTWDGWDYVPHAWPFWLTADDGVLLVASAGPATDGRPAADRDGQPLAVDRPLAIARVALTGPAEAWLEGIRVDPRVRGMDVATDLQVAELAWASAQRATVVRYATGETNEGSHRLGARHGFRLLATFRTYWWSASGEDQSREDETGYNEPARVAANTQRAGLLDRLAASRLIARADEAAAWWRVLQVDATFLAAQRLYEHRAWALQELTEEGFARHVAAGELIVTGQPRDGAPWGLAILEREALPAEDTSLHLGLLCGEGGAALELLATMQAMSSSPLRFRLAGDEPPVLRSKANVEALAAAGFAAREWTLHILGRELAPADPLPEPSDAGLILGDEPAHVIRAPA